MKYLIRVMKMEKDQWPRICLRETLRGLKNRNPGRWARELKEILEKLGSTGLIDTMWRNDIDESIKEIGDLITKKIDC